MTIIVLLGRHGSGKSTFGRLLENHGIKHISVGLLRRLALNKEYPIDVPPSLLSHLRLNPRNTDLNNATSEKLVDLALTYKHCVIDGFPTNQRHLELLPADTQFCYLWTPKKIRHERLVIRSVTSKRIWINGKDSLRETQLSGLIKTIQKNNKINFISNTQTEIKESAQKIAEKIY